MLYNLFKENSVKNYLKIPYIKFRKSCLHNWAKWKYIASENKKQDKAKKEYLKYTSLVLSGKDKQAKEFNEKYNFDPLVNILSALIGEFTYKEINKDNFEPLVQALAVAGISVQIISDIMFISSNEFSFCVKKLSLFEPKIMNKLGDIEEDSRNGKCHPYGVVSTLYFDKLKEYETKFVTGRIYQLTPRAKYLHSWVEISDKENTFVVDPTKNAVYLKEIFYDINHVGEVSKLTALEVKTDYKMIKALTDYDNYAVKVYYENPERGKRLYEKLISAGEICETIENGK